MIYKAYLEQGGEGCDYTIACGKKVVNLNATNLEDATKEIGDYIIEWYGHDSEIECIELYEINNVVNINVDDIYSEQNKLDLEQREKEEEEKERSEFERLSKKFNK